MATCVQASEGGYLFPSADPLAECSGWVLMDALEYSQVPTLQALFAWPDPSDLGQIWLVGFSLPMIVYLAAWGFGKVVNYFNPEHERN